MADQDKRAASAEKGKAFGKTHKRVLIALIAVVCVAAIVAGIILACHSCNVTPAGPATSDPGTSEPNVTPGDDVEHPGEDPEPGESTDNTDSAQSTGASHKPQKTDSNAPGTTTTTKKGGGATTTAPPTGATTGGNHPGSQIPDATTSPNTHAGNNGFVDYTILPPKQRQYEEYRHFNVLPTNYLEMVRNSRTLLREDLFVESETFRRPNDSQLEINQRDSYIFEDVGVKVTDPTKAYWVKYGGNPVLWGQNLYTPWVVKDGDTWFVYYGGYGNEYSNGLDTTFLATTKDPEMRSGWTLHGPVVTPAGVYACAQDPAVAKKGDTWVMVYSYTRAHGVYRDWIGVSTSKDGIHWTPDFPEESQHEITVTNIDRLPSFDVIGRPSLYYNEEKARWEMYCDGQIRGKIDPNDPDKREPQGTMLFYSTEDVPMNWTFEGTIIEGMGETCLAVIDGVYYLGARPTKETWPTRMKMYKSTDGIHFQEDTFTLLGERAPNGDTQSISMMAFAVDKDEITAILYGRTLDGWTHKVSIAYPQKYVEAWRGGEKMDEEPFAVSANSQGYKADGSTSAVTYYKTYDAYGEPASQEKAINLRPNMAYYIGDIPAKPDAPILRAPVNNSTDQHWGPAFSWGATKGAQGYKLMVAEDAAFTKMAFTVNTLLTNSYRPERALKEGQTYYWKVIAKNANGQQESAVHKFTVVASDKLIGEFLSVTPTKVTATEDADAESSTANLSDGPYYSTWTSPFDLDTGVLPSFTMDYGKVYPFSRFYYIARPDSVGVPLDFKLEYSLDGVHFAAIDPKELEHSDAYSGITCDYYTLTKGPIHARFIRFTITQALGSVGSLGEFRSQVIR